MRAMGLTPMNPPSVEASRIDAMRELWRGAGFDAVETREIAVQRTFADFEDYWATSLLGASVGPTIATMSPGEIDRLKERVRARMPAADAGGGVADAARANAVKGRVPK